MDREEQGTRAERIAKGMGIEVPDDLHYLWASGYRFSDAFLLILEAVDELGVRVVALDSLGMALEGDALKGAVCRASSGTASISSSGAGVSVLIVDHQSGLRPGESYQNKAQYGSVYKAICLDLGCSSNWTNAMKQGPGSSCARTRPTSELHKCRLW